MFMCLHSSQLSLLEKNDIFHVHMNTRLTGTDGY